MLALYGSLSFVYGIIHASSLAICLFALIAMEIKASRLLKIYVCMLVLLVFFDFSWLCMYTAAIATEKTGMSTTTAAELAATMKWGPAATRINNWVCLFAEFIQFFIRVASLPLWVVMWMKGLLDGTGAYEDPMTLTGNQGGMPPQAYHPPGEFVGDFSHVLPTGPVEEGRIMGRAGGGRSQNFTGFNGGYQQQEGDSL
jgi:hypothetical protein|mmetsp:Transcript_35607/g.57219  ORF Transcript_35607/g.57219 Transcript_35607/m.57219 type:complete len:199 (+) Transcript_35607:650-1246(+)